jgi:hypothetical protein
MTRKIRFPDDYQMGFVVLLSLLPFVAGGFDWRIGLGAFVVWYLVAMLGANVL